MKIISQVNRQLEPLIQRIQHHPLYAQMISIENLQRFMEHHVFAVWDFMCLLKELHRRFVSIRAPWFPPEDSLSAHLIGGILREEESDRTPDQQTHCSHFELYVHAMRSLHADTRPIEHFLKRLKQGDILIHAMESAELSVIIQQFVLTTFSFFDQETHILAAAFVYGREAITPVMFTPLIRQLKQAIAPSQQALLQPFLHYLNRHIELDHDEHFPQALKFLYHLAGEDEKKWRDIALHARLALQARLDFLDGIQEKIMKNMIGPTNVIFPSLKNKGEISC